MFTNVVQSLAKSIPKKKKVLVNTCGWVEGGGKDLLFMIMKVCECDTVIGMQKGTNVNPFLQELQS